MGANREAYIQQVKAKLDEWTGEIERLRARADAAKVEVRQKMQRQVKDLQTRRDRLHQKLQALRQGGEEAFDDLRKGVDAAWSDLKTAMSRVRAR